MERVIMIETDVRVYIYVGYRWSYHVALVSRGETENFWSA